MLIFSIIINEFILFVGRFLKLSFYVDEEKFQVRRPSDANIIEKLKS